MSGLFEFVMQYGTYALLLAAVNLFMAIQIVSYVCVNAGWKVAEAMGARRKLKSLYSRCGEAFRQTLRLNGKSIKKAGIFEKAAVKMKKSGYTGEYAPYIYLLLKFIIVPLVFAAALVINFPDVLPAFAVPLCLLSVIETVIASNHRKNNLKLQKYMYKIYKYLHSQISSGVRVVDAIRTVYEVIDDIKLRSILIRFAAYYELTMDIDKALEEFGSNFDAHEAEALGVVIRQGIETGDNQDLLARQEEVMFKKYFNYIQAETDSCKSRCLLAAAMYTAIVVIMIIIPLLNDASEAFGKIFAN